MRVDRKLLEERTRRFLKSYLEADEARKPQFYRAVDDVSRKCHSTEPSGLVQSDFEDGRIAEIAFQAAMQMVLDRTDRIKENDRVGNFCV